jgi:F420-dependent oxidoreductase-like protein
MELGVFLNHQGAVHVARRAEQLGYTMALVPEGFRSDAVSVLGAVAAVTERIGLASGLMQIPARTPVMTALSAATLHALSGGRFRLGLGVSNPDVSLGWYGQPFEHPLQRTREYVEIVRLALRGEPVRYAGKHYRLPPDGTTEAAQLRAAAIHSDIPILLGAIGRRSLKLADKIADGWIGAFCSPQRIADSLAHCRTAGVKRGIGGGRAFEVLPSVPIAVNADLEAAAAPLRGYFANFIGLGSSERSIYYRLAAELGYESAAADIHRYCRAGDRAAAARAVPLELIDEVSLIGDVPRIARRMAAYERAGVTTLGLTPLSPTVNGQLDTIEAAAAALDAMRRAERWSDFQTAGSVTRQLERMAMK